MIEKLFDLNGKKALVTGGSKGIGRAISFGLASVGAIPHIVCRNEKEGRDTLDEIASATGIQGEVYIADLSSKKSTSIPAEIDVIFSSLTPNLLM